MKAANLYSACILPKRRATLLPSTTLVSRIGFYLTPQSNKAYNHPIATTQGKGRDMRTASLLSMVLVATAFSFAIADDPQADVCKNMKSSGATQLATANREAMAGV